MKKLLLTTIALTAIGLGERVDKNSVIKNNESEVNIGDIKVRIQVMNIEKYRKLLFKAQKEAEQLNETIAQLNKFKLDIKVK